MQDRAEVIRQLTELLIAKHQENQQSGEQGEFDAAALIAEIEQALQEIMSEFDGDLSEVSDDELADIISDVVAGAVEAAG